MRKNRKILLLSLCMAAILTVSTMGTMAYLADQESVVNTFTIGSVNIELNETAVTPDGQPIEGAQRVKENVYHLVPGGTYVKDPTVTVINGSEDAYVRLLVTINEIADLKTLFGETFLPEVFVSGWDRDKWPCVNVSEAIDDSVTYEFRYITTVNAKAGTDVVLDALFDTVTVPDSLTSEQLQNLGDLRITVVGHAIQANGFDSADQAWEAFAP